MTTIRLLADRVLVEPLEERDVKKGGIVIPDSAKGKPQEGEVVTVGPGKLDDDGKTVPMTVKRGQRVLMPKYGGMEIEIDDKKYLILREIDILGVIE